MTLNETDQLLWDWQRKLELASQNLLDLQNLPTYQRLAGEGGFAKAPLTGLTAQEVEPALQAMHNLFQYFDLLSQTIDKALFLRRQMNNFWGTDPRLQNVVDILQGKSIQLSQVEKPLSQRGLLDLPQQSYCVTPTELLTAMQSAFDTARDQVLAVDHAWATLEFKLLDAATAIQTLEAEGGDLSLAKATLEQLQERVFTDPLGVKDEFDRTITPCITQVQQHLNQAKNQRQQVEQALIQARQQWQQLQALQQQVSQVYTNALGKVQLQAHPGLSPTSLTALEQWLQRLEAKFAEGAVTPTQVGLQNWTQQFNQAMHTLQTTIASHTQVLQQRQELRGRLDALQAKALARGVAQDPTLVHFSLQAQQLLYNLSTDLPTDLPSNLQMAAELISGYERWLNKKWRC